MLNNLFQLELDHTPIVKLPEETGDLHFIQKLELRNCRSLKFLPKSIGVILQMNKCQKLKRLPNSFGDLKSLYHLYMEETSVVELPESFGYLSNLMTLKMLKKPLFRSDTQGSTSEKPGFVIPNSFSNLESLEEVDARSWGITGKIPDVFEKLTSLKILNLGNNYFHSLPSSLKRLTNLKELILYDCQELTSLPPLPCNLEKLNLATACHWRVGCNSDCSSDVKKRLPKVSLKMLRNLSVPRDRIPEWFSQGPVRYSAQPNRELRGVIISVVVSVSQQSKDDFHVPDVLGLHICRYSHHYPMVSMLKEGYTIQVIKQKMLIKQDAELKMHGIHLVYEGDDDLGAEESDCVTETMQTVSQKLANFFRSLQEGEEASSQVGSTVT
ncbi:hypothetical protein F2Q69_00050395 [Brassica cretica]|uniref:Uncharacterized protein n=1 Tax=Brassica cretica TaxID=69181 RepID=A0A8S9Q5U2_BRACR|nr:hypothetical protein F2Q69_00050395 [Brassica cretica]